MSNKVFHPLLSKIRTPISVINLANRGGVNFSTLVEVYGDTKGGKSTFCYQTASNLLADYGDQAQVVILATEGTVNYFRLKMAFGMDTSGADSRVVVEPAFTIEMANDAIARWSQFAWKQKKFTVIIWDSLKAASFNRAKEVMDTSMEKNEVAERGATEPMARAQVMGWCLNNALHSIYQKPVTVFLINQLTTKVNQFNTSLDSSGGFSLKHNVEERFRISMRKAVGGEAKDAVFKTGTMSELTVVKSRNIPSFLDIPMLIDDTSGGVIVTANEIPLVAVKLGIMAQKSGGWYSIAESHQYVGMPEEYKKSKQLLDIMKDTAYLDILNTCILNTIRAKFKLIDYMYKSCEEIEMNLAGSIEDKPKARVTPAKSEKVKKE